MPKMPVSNPFRANFVLAIKEQDYCELAQDPAKLKFLCSISVKVEQQH